jgi:predicted permease
MDSIARDLRNALRSLGRSPGFLIVAVLTLALGIGATTAIFTVVDAVLLRPLPYPAPERLVAMYERNARGGEMDFSDPDFEDVRDRARLLEAAAQVSDFGSVSVAGASDPVRARAAAVSRDFFRVLGVSPIVGRAFVEEEQREGGSPAVIVSESFWRQHLGGAPIGDGRTLTFNNRVHTVVGVMPRALDYPEGVSLWTPRELEGRLPSRTAHNWSVIARVRAGASVDAARTEVRALARQIRAEVGDRTDMVDASVTPLQDEMVGSVRPALLLLLGASVVLLAIACANVVNLQVARTATRRGELAIRLALGATRGVLVRQSVAEALVLAVGGGLLGVIAATASVRALLALVPGDLPRAGDIGVRWSALLFALALAVISAVLMGMVAAWRASAADVRTALTHAGRSPGGVSREGIRSALVVTQIAATLVLLVGAGLLGRSFLRLLEVDPGFRTSRAVVMNVPLPFAEDSAGKRDNVRTIDEVLERVRQIPGVEAAGGVSTMPLSGEDGGDGTFLILQSVSEPLPLDDIEAVMRDPSRTGHAEFRIASADYFRAMNIPLVRGRLFDDRDAPDAPHAAVITASLADTRWPGEDPIGRVIEFGNMDGDLTPFTVVGVVGDVRERNLANPPRPTLYGSYRQRPTKASRMTLVMSGEALRDDGQLARVSADARRALRDVRPDVPPQIRTIETVLASSVADRRFILVLIGAFGGAALLLATLGVYGLVSYLAVQRKSEMAIRVAVGASPADVFRLVLSEGARLGLIGVALGAVVALALTRTISGLLYDVPATDPLAFGGVALLLILVPAIASTLPARRAARVDPMRDLA